MRIYKLVTVNGSPLPVGSLGAETLVLFDNDTWTISNSYSDSHPEPDAGTYIQSGSVITLTQAGASHGAGTVGCETLTLVAGGVTAVYVLVAKL